MPTKIRIGGDVVGRYGMHRGLGPSGWFVAAVYLCGVSSWPQADNPGFSRPVPPPPPPGELRKVRLTYMCTLCGTEVRMTRSPNSVPEGPRCCMEEMELIRDHDND